MNPRDKFQVIRNGIVEKRHDLWRPRGSTEFGPTEPNLRYVRDR